MKIENKRGKINRNKKFVIQMSKWLPFWESQVTDKAKDMLKLYNRTLNVQSLEI